MQDKTMLYAGTKFLVFMMGQEAYAMNIGLVQEIKAFEETMEITPIIDSPSHIKGMIKLNDFIVPIIDLRIFYHLKQAEKHAFDVIIIIKAQQKLIGVMVDSVMNIVELKAEQIKSAPDFLNIIHEDCIEGIAEIDDQLIPIINIEKLIFSKALKFSEENQRP